MKLSKVFLKAARECEREYPRMAGYAPHYVGNASADLEQGYCGPAYRMLFDFALDNLYGDEAILGICLMAAVSEYQERTAARRGR